MARAEQSTWSEVAGRYRAEWEQRYGTDGGGWEEYEPAYRYAWEWAHTPGIQYGRSWGDVEPELRRHWEESTSSMSWERAGDIVRELWEEASHGGRRLYEGDARAPEAQH